MKARFLIAWTVGFVFAMGMVLIVDTGEWQQPVGFAMVWAAVGFIVAYMLARGAPR